MNMFNTPLQSCSDVSWLVGIVEVAGHAIGDEEIEAPVAVEVPEFHRPRPVGGVQPCHEGRIHEPARASVHVEAVSHVLRGIGILHEPLARSHDSHGAWNSWARAPPSTSSPNWHQPGPAE